MWSHDRANPSFEYACIENEYGFKQSMFPCAHLVASEMRVHQLDFLISNRRGYTLYLSESFASHSEGQVST